MACKYTKTQKNAIATYKHDDMKVSEATKAFSAPKGTLHDHIRKYTAIGAATLTSKDEQEITCQILAEWVWDDKAACSHLATAPRKFLRL